MARSAKLKAFAKINLGLRVLYKRPDGYHELRTVFQTISLADEIGMEFRRTRSTRIEIHGTPSIPDNLVERAARLILEDLQIHADIKFHLKKHIPMGAGLGGGSTDAAAVLLALPALAGKKIAPGRLAEMAAQLGSDVPFFLYGGRALGLGRGEELYPLPEPKPMPGILIAPPVHSSTAEAYRDLSRELTLLGLQNKLGEFQKEIWGGLSGSAVNDFEEVVYARHPVLRGLRDRLAQTGARPAVMSGSGSSIFGLFADRAAQEKAFRTLGKELREAKVFRFSLVSRAQYQSAWKRMLTSIQSNTH